MTPPGELTISVVVCTYNRASRLAETLEHFQTVTVPENVNWELVVVDNRSTDDTARVIRDVAARTKLPIRQTYEPMPGLGAARNRGIRESSGAIIAFTDDDIFPAADWLCVLAREFSADPQLSGLGGRVELHNPLDLPLTLRTSRERFQMIRTWSLLNGIPGCNMAFRREVIAATGGFDPDFGAGAPLVSAEDIEFIFRAIRRDFKLIYSPDLLVTHDHGRRTQAQASSLTRSYLIGRGAMYYKHVIKLDSEMIKMSGREVLFTLRQLFIDFMHLRLPRRAARTLYLLAAGALLALRTYAARGGARMFRKSAALF